MDFADAASGRLIVTPYQLQKVGSVISLRLAVRYPVTYQEHDVTHALTAAAFPRTQITVIRSMPGILHDKNDPRLAALRQAYEQVTGRE